MYYRIRNGIQEQGIPYRLDQIIRLFKSWRFIKFCIIGSSGIVVNLGIFYLLRRANVHANLSSVCAIEISIVSNFLFNHNWTFRDRRAAKLRMGAQAIRYHVASLVGAAIQFLTFVTTNMVWFMIIFNAETRFVYHSAANGWWTRWIWNPVVIPPDVGNLVFISQLAGIAVASLWNYYVNYYWTWPVNVETTA